MCTKICPRPVILTRHPGSIWSCSAAAWGGPTYMSRRCTMEIGIWVLSGAVAKSCLHSYLCTHSTSRMSVDDQTSLRGPRVTMAIYCSLFPPPRVCGCAISAPVSSICQLHTDFCSHAHSHASTRTHPTHSSPHAYLQHTHPPHSLNPPRILATHAQRTIEVGDGLLFDEHLSCDCPGVTARMRCNGTNEASGGDYGDDNWKV